MATMASNLFERLGRQRFADSPEQREPEIVRRGPQPIIPPAHHKSSPSEKLLAWLINYWGRPTITARDISCYGPNCARDPMDRISLTKTLVACGWLAPVKAHRLHEEVANRSGAKQA